jgi:hypothetical protein
MLSLWFFAHWLSDSLGMTAAILFSMKLAGVLKEKRVGEGYEHTNTIKLDEMKVGSHHPQTCLRNKPHFRFQKSFISTINRSMQAFGTTELTTQQNLISQSDIHWRKLHVH